MAQNKDTWVANLTKENELNWIQVRLRIDFTKKCGVCYDIKLKASVKKGTVFMFFFYFQKYLSAKLLSALTVYLLNIHLQFKNYADLSGNWRTMGKLHGYLLSGKYRSVRLGGPCPPKGQ
jgi:hypothetical protein